MASQGMSIEDAARHLGVTARTVRSYISQSLLAARREPGNTRKWLDPVEVEELRKDRVSGTAQSRETRRGELLELRATVRRLRAEMDLVLRVLDAHEAPLAVSGESARVLHEAAVRQLGVPSWSLDELVQWADIFMRLQEEDLLEVSRVVHDLPYVVFLRLCVAMLVHARSRPEYATSLDLQLAHRRLTEARRRLRVAALCYADVYGAGDGATDRDVRRAALLDAPETVRENLLRRSRKTVHQPA